MERDKQFKGYLHASLKSHCWADQHSVKEPLNLSDQLELSSYVVVNKVGLDYLSAYNMLVACIINIAVKMDVTYKTRPLK